MSATSTLDSSAMIRRYTDRLDAIFREAATKHEAHRQSAAVMEEIVADRSFLTAVLARHISKLGALNTRNYPVVGIDVESNPYYDLVVNCWIPLPSGETDVTTKAIHHHGELLLTTGTAFGPGYEHWMLAKPEMIDPERDLYSMRLLEHGQHALHEVDFVDSYVAHVPLYPPSLTITVCLWSSRGPKTWKDTVKRIEILRRNSATLRNAFARAGLARALDLKVVDTFDFYPTVGGFVGMKDREEFPRGPNEDHLHSLFHIIQQTGNDDLADVIEEQLEGNGTDHPELVLELLERLRTGAHIEGRLSDGHYGVPYANFHRADIERALATQPSA
jgi:hypothetical protein